MAGAVTLMTFSNLLNVATFLLQEGQPCTVKARKLRTNRATTSIKAPFDDSESGKKPWITQYMTIYSQ